MSPIHTVGFTPTTSSHRDEVGGIWLVVVAVGLTAAVALAARLVTG